MIDLETLCNRSTPNEAFLKEWLEALRGGEYKQAKGALLDINDAGERSFCCLGVACDIYAKNHKPEGMAIEWVDDSLVIKYKDEDGYLVKETYDSELPTYVAAKLGFQSNYGAYAPRPDAPGNISLIYHNDDDLMTFSQIADIIENKLVELMNYDRI